MILSDKQILETIDKKQIVITPFDIECLGPNSYDVHLSKHLAIYDMDKASFSPLHGSYIDSKKHNEVKRFVISDDGYILMPGQFYLGSTIEYTETHVHMPTIDGKSSIGRLSIKIHDTAGKGDVGFCNHWTLEITCTVLVKVYAGMPIGQLIYHEVGETDQSYATMTRSKYAEVNPLPKESLMFKNKF